MLARRLHFGSTDCIIMAYYTAYVKVSLTYNSIHYKREQLCLTARHILGVSSERVTPTLFQIGYDDFIPLQKTHLLVRLLILLEINRVRRLHKHLFNCKHRRSSMLYLPLQSTKNVVYLVNGGMQLKEGQTVY